jgi:hypothetical protein
MTKKNGLTEPVGITIRNNLNKEKREISVYHHSRRMSHIVSHNRSLNHILESMDKGDYIQVSVVSGPGHLNHTCILVLPSFLDFTFSATGDVTIEHFNQRLMLKIPPGPPTWEIKMSLPSRSIFTHSHGNKIITIGDGEKLPNRSDKPLRQWQERFSRT